MPEYFDDSSFTLDECNQEQFSVHNAIENQKNYQSVIQNYLTYDIWWDKTRLVLNACFNIASESGKAGSVLSHKEGCSYDGYHRYFLANPAAFKSFDVWVLYHTIKNVELEFIDRCKTPRNEVALTAKLTEVISTQAKLIQRLYEKHLCLNNSYINLSEVELQVQNREKLVGADIGFLLEWKDEEGNLQICPILLQAKRVVSEIADISQSNNTQGYQFNILKKSKANPVYMFYHCNTQKPTDNPRIVAIKNIDDIKTTRQPDKTSAVQGVLSMSSFFLEIMNNTNKYTICTNRAVALASILNSLREEELYGIFSFSVDESAGLKYTNAYNDYKNFKKPKRDNS